MSYTHMNPDELLAELEASERSGRIIDVREPHEWDYYRLDEAELMPMNSIPGRLDELDRSEQLYIVCAHGVRSERVCAYLADNGFTRVVNVRGGMAAIGSLRGFQYD